MQKIEVEIQKKNVPTMVGKSHGKSSVSWRAPGSTSTAVVFIGREMAEAPKV